MARTSRTAAPNNVAALDNIDLDDMFTDGADDLFAGLDIDIDMDEIDTTTPTAQPQHSTTTASSTKNKSTKSQSKLPTASSLAAANEGASTTGPSVATSRSRRKTKRKVMEDDDDSYEEPQTKKTKRKPAKRKGQAKKASSEQVAPTSSILASFTKQRPTAALPKAPLTKAPQLAHPKNSGTQASASSSSAMGSGSSSNGGSLKRKAPPRTSSQATSQYCGISPSNTVFYPFLDLPTEFLLKSKKPFPTVDKVHAAFQSQLQQQQQQQAPNPKQPPPENDPLIRLLRDGKLDAETVARAVTAMRSTLTPASTSIADWHNIARILQRQHDFLQQSAANMQAWCRNNYSEAEFAEVYSGTVLRTFQTPHIKVKILLGKDKNKTLLPATLPSYIVRNTTTTSTGASSTTAASSRPKASTSKTTATSRPKPVASVPQPPTPYTHLCSAAARRKAIADRLSQVAPLAAVTPSAAGPHYRPMVLPSLPTTVSMWKWLEQTGYWGTTTANTMGPRVARAAKVEPWEVPATTTTSDVNETKTPMPPLSVQDRLQSLLVEEEDDDNDDDYDAMEEDDDVTTTVDKDCMESSSALLDASALSVEERWHWLLQRSGWGQHEGTSSSSNAPTTAASATTTTGTEIEDTINTMIEDLHATDGLNNERLSYLESVWPSGDESKKTRQQETALMAKCQQLLIKKSKEKAKAAVVSKRDDDIKLPW